MATPTINAIGFCAHYSKQGDWAFEFALELTKRFNKRLNVFHFLSDPYDPSENYITALPHSEKEKLAIAKEKELRLYYDELAGDYLDVGFRVCYDKSWTELHRCLVIREFQVLVLGYTGHNVYFANKTIEKFAESFVSPAILVGPGRPDEYYLNEQAALLVNQLGIKNYKWLRLEPEPL
ncbi:MAG: hypothetical protein ACOC2K_04205 [Bacteroidota bacterium]